MLLLPHENMARWAVSHLFEAASVSAGRHEKTKMERSLIERRSVARLAGAAKPSPSDNMSFVV